jgi:hypothetical protein
VNVVEYVDGTLSSIHSWKDDPEGNKEAEEFFTICAKANDFDDDDIEVGLEDGYIESVTTDHKLFLIHS